MLCNYFRSYVPSTLGSLELNTCPSAAWYKTLTSRRDCVYMKCPAGDEASKLGQKMWL